MTQTTCALLLLVCTPYCGSLKFRDVCHTFLEIKCSCSENVMNELNISCGPDSDISKLPETFSPSQLRRPIRLWKFESIENLKIPWIWVSSNQHAVQELRLSHSVLACSCSNAWIALHATLNSTIVKDLEYLCPNCSPSSELTQWNYLGLPVTVNVDGVSLRDTKKLMSHCHPQTQTFQSYLEHFCDIPKLEVNASQDIIHCKIASKSGCLYTNVLPYFSHLMTNESRLKVQTKQRSPNECQKSSIWNLTSMPIEDSGWVECLLISDHMASVKYIDTLRKNNFRNKQEPEIIQWKETCHLPNWFSVDFTIVGRPMPKLRWYQMSKDQMSMRIIEPANVVNELNSNRIIYMPDPHYADGFEGGWAVTSGRIKFQGPDKYCTAGFYFLEACSISATDHLAIQFLDNKTLDNCLLKTFEVCSADDKTSVCREFIQTSNEQANGMSESQEEDIGSNHKNYSLLLTGGLISLALLCFIICVLYFAFYYKHLRNKRLLTSSSNLDQFRCLEETIPLNETNKDYIVCNRSSLKPESVPYVSHEEVICIRPLGEGAFGEVLLVKYKPKRTLTFHDETIKAQGVLYDGMLLAMKQLKYVTAERQADVEREASMLKALKHPNIVKFYGMCTKEDGLALLFEYMKHGDLVKFLRDHNPDLNPSAVELSREDLLRISLQACSALQYLHSLHLVHRDLAARNCLVGEELIVKLSDFGMTRDIYVCDYYKVGTEALVPLRWLPPESMLYRKFTPESDVWSFGVLLWEIFSLGQVPWYQYSNSEVLEVVKEGRCMKQPSMCPEYMYKDIILRCWKVSPSQRLTAEQVKLKLESLTELSFRYTTVVENNCGAERKFRASLGVIPRLRGSNEPNETFQNLERQFSVGSKADYLVNGRKLTQ